MIVRMNKYTFVLLHRRQEEFIRSLQDIGLVDVTTAGWEPDDRERALLASVEQHRAAAVRLGEMAAAGEISAGAPYGDGGEAFERYREASAALEEIRGRAEKLRKEIDELSVWGDFAPESIAALAADGVRMRFFSVYGNEYAAIAEKWGGDFLMEKIAESGGRAYFVVVETGDDRREIPFDAQEYRVPEATADQRRAQLEALEAESRTWLDVMGRVYASADMLALDGDRLLETLDLSRASRSGDLAAEDTLTVMEGWAAAESAEEVERMLDSFPDVVWFCENPKPEDDAPVLLKNNKFANPFEIIGNFYSLPRYGTLDLTAFFGPFYMIFFGFCLGDAGYGLLLLLAGIFMMTKKTKAMRQVAALTVLCGSAALLFGFLAGSFFGVQLAGLPAFEGIRDKFLDTDSLFTLSLALGGVQIVFALVLNVINTSRRFGFKYSLGTLGWLLVLLGIAGSMLLPGLPQAAVTALYGVAGVGAVLMLFFNNPDRNPLLNFGSGLWNTYNNVTGLLGDILSYIRLFALCLSGGTLALVFNDLAFGLTADLPIVARQLAAIVILLFGHGINLFMSALGAFVHPMRLTFVEFYKNAGFEGTQREFAPLRRHTKR